MIAVLSHRAIQKRQQHSNVGWKMVLLVRSEAPRAATRGILAKASEVNIQPGMKKNHD